jgi:hypothetical protein
MEIYRGVDAADERDRRYKTAIVFNRCEKCEYQLPLSPTETRKAIEEGSKKSTKGTSQGAWVVGPHCTCISYVQTLCVDFLVAFDLWGVAILPPYLY